MIKKLINYLSIYKRKLKYKKISYSFNCVDLIVNHIFKKKNNGFYLDIGSQHPISNNNTYLLHKRGWKGINIDLDKRNIDLFNMERLNDININCAISDTDGESELFYYHQSSPINTLNKDVSNFQSAKIKEIKKIKTRTLDSVLEKLNFNNLIDYMNIFILLLL